MAKEWVRKRVGNLTFKRDVSGNSKKGDGYELLMSIVDRKVFGVEDDSITSVEFSHLCKWLTEEFEKSDTVRVSGKIIKSDPIVIAEVIGGEPVFVEIHDYKARYRVNVYQETEEVEIEVLNPIKDKRLEYTAKRRMALNL